MCCGDNPYFDSNQLIAAYSLELGLLRLQRAEVAPVKAAFLSKRPQLDQLAFRRMLKQRLSLLTRAGKTVQGLFIIRRQMTRHHTGLILFC